MGQIIWITGLSGSGKSTLALALTLQLRAENNVVVMLDGDELRSIFGAATSNIENHGYEGRLALAMKYSKLCRLIAMQGPVVVIATISMFKEIHLWNRENLPGYFEVYLRVPLDELRRRDPKGIYRSFDSGQLTNVAGLDLPIHEPEAADLVIEFSQGQEVENNVNQLMNQLQKRDVN